MSGFHLLTLLTVLPLVGAAVALVAGRHARAVALVTTLASLALALVVWTQLPVDGSIGLVERAAWSMRRTAFTTSRGFTLGWCWCWNPASSAPSPR